MRGKELGDETDAVTALVGVDDVGVGRGVAVGGRAEEGGKVDCTRDTARVEAEDGVADGSSVRWDDVGVEPEGTILGVLEEDGHPRVDPLDVASSLGGDNGDGVGPWLVSRLGAESSHKEDVVARLGERDVVRVAAHPLVEPLHGNDAPPPGERREEHVLLQHRLGPHVDNGRERG